MFCKKLFLKIRKIHWKYVRRTLQVFSLQFFQKRLRHKFFQWIFEKFLIIFLTEQHLRQLYREWQKRPKNTCKKKEERKLQDLQELTESNGKQFSKKISYRNIENYPWTKILHLPIAPISNWTGVNILWKYLRGSTVTWNGITFYRMYSVNQADISRRHFHYKKVTVSIIVTI